MAGMAMQTRKILAVSVVAFVFLALGVSIPATLSAALYKYERGDGTILLTNERRPDLKLVEIVSGSPKPSPNRSSSNSSDSSETGSNSSEERSKSSSSSQNGSSGSYGPLRRDRFDDLIREASDAYDIPFAFVKAVIRVESDFTPDAVSHAGAMGLMQLMPATADQLNVTDPFNPRQNIFGGTKLLRRLIDQYDGDINLILSAYNAGGAAVAEYDGIPYRKTRQYVASVFRWYEHYSETEKGGRE